MNGIAFRFISYGQKQPVSGWVGSIAQNHQPGKRITAVSCNEEYLSGYNYWPARGLGSDYGYFDNCSPAGHDRNSVHADSCITASVRLRITRHSLGYHMTLSGHDGSHASDLSDSKEAITGCSVHSVNETQLLWSHRSWWHISSAES